MYINYSGAAYLPPYGVFDMNCTLYDHGWVITSTLDMCMTASKVAFRGHLFVHNDSFPVILGTSILTNSSSISLRILSAFAAGHKRDRIGNINGGRPQCITHIPNQQYRWKDLPA